MPKSRRVRDVPLTQAKSRGFALKTELVQSLRDAVDEHSAVYVFSFDNMRTNRFKEVRQAWQDSRFFMGKNRVMQLALGRSPEDEYRPNLWKLSEHVEGHVGLLVTSRPHAEVLEFFDSFQAPDYARAGFASPVAVSVAQGPLPQFIGSMVEPLRALGLPVDLTDGTVVLRRDHVVCNAGDVLTPEQAKLLTHFDHKLATFRLTIRACWRAANDTVEVMDV